MLKSQENVNLHSFLKKFAHSKNQAAMIETLVCEKPLASDSPARLIDELARCFLHLQGACKTWTGNEKVHVSGIIDALGEVAGNHGIPVARFYPALLEKLLFEEPDEAMRFSSKPTTKERILEAALEVFSQKGFHTATTDEIAERAGVGKGTLYRYFETKEKLFAELVRLRLDELERKAGAIIDGDDDVLTMISKYIRIYFEFFDHNQHLYRLVVQEQLDLGEHSPDHVLQKSHARSA